MASPRDGISMRSPKAAAAFGSCTGRALAPGSLAAASPTRRALRPRCKPPDPRRKPDRQEAVQVRRRPRALERLRLRLLRLGQLRASTTPACCAAGTPVERVHELGLRRPRQVGDRLRARRPHVPDGRRPAVRHDRPRARRDPLAPRHALDERLRGAAPGGSELGGAVTGEQRPGRGGRCFSVTLECGG